MTKYPKTRLAYLLKEKAKMDKANPFPFPTDEDLYREDVELEIMEIEDHLESLGA